MPWMPCKFPLGMFFLGGGGVCHPSGLYTFKPHSLTTHSSPASMPLSTVLPVMAFAIMSMWAAHCTHEASPVHESVPETSPIQESDSEASLVHESAPETSPACPVTSMEAFSELSVCSNMTMEAVQEISACSVTIKWSVHVSSSPWFPALPAPPWLPALHAPPWLHAPLDLTRWSPGLLLYGLPLFHGPGPPLFHSLPLLHGLDPTLLHGPGPPLLCSLDLPMPHGPSPPLPQSPGPLPCHDTGPVPLHGPGPPSLHQFHLHSTILLDFWGFALVGCCVRASGAALGGGGGVCNVGFGFCFLSRFSGLLFLYFALFHVPVVCSLPLL